MVLMELYGHDPRGGTHTIQSFFLPVTVRLWNTFIPACILAVFRCTQVKMLIFKNQNDEIDGYVPNVISIYVYKIFSIACNTTDH